MARFSIWSAVRKRCGILRMARRAGSLCIKARRSGLALFEEAPKLHTYADMKRLLAKRASWIVTSVPD